MTRKGNRHPLYQTWQNIKQRCHNPGNPYYRWYGARGISMCPAWRDDCRAFLSWVDDNLGARPEGCTLDRIEVNGDYEPGNLRWATYAEQVSNRRPMANKIYPGIHRCKGSYEARIMRNGVRGSLGTRRDAWEAACLYADAKGIPRPVRPEPAQ
jgi:hypothetical protein